MIGCFNLPQTERERNEVRIKVAVCGEECCMTTLRTAAKESTDVKVSLKNFPMIFELFKCQ